MFKQSLLFFTCLPFLLITSLGLKSQPPEFVWANQLELSSFSHYPYNFAKDELGNIYTSGIYSGTIDFDPGPGVYTMTTNNSAYNWFVCKFDNNGNFIWAKQIENNLIEYRNAIATDRFGNVYLAGSFKDTVDFDPGNGMQNLIAANKCKDLYILKLDPNGNFQWVKQFAGFNAEIFIASLLLNDSGEIFVTGNFNGNADFDPGPSIFRMNALQAAYFVKLNDQGNLIWSEFIDFDNSIGNLTTKILSDLDRQGNLVIVGNFNGQFDFDPDTGLVLLTSVSTKSDGFILKLNNFGKLIWVKQINGTGYMFARSITTDKELNTYISGSFNNSVDFNPDIAVDNSLISISSQDAFLLKLDSSGIFKWVKQFTGSKSCAFDGVTTDYLNGIFMVGFFEGVCDFDPGLNKSNLTSNGSDVVILKLSEKGDFEWAKKIGNSGYDIGLKIKSDSTNIYFTGYYEGMVGFNPIDSNLNKLNSQKIRPVLTKWNICNTALNLKLITCDSIVLNKISYTQSGTYKQVIKNARGCDSSITLELKVSKPVAKFTLQAQAGCQYVAYTFTDSSFADTVSAAGFNYFWDYGDGTTSTIKSPIKLQTFKHTYNQSGTYTVKLVFSNGFCSDSFSIINNVLIQPAPKPGFTLNAQHGCTPFLLQLKDTLKSNIVLKEYDFGDGFKALNSSQALDTTMLFPKPGTFIIRQRLTGITGCITQFEDTIYITPGLTKSDTVNMLYTTVVDSFMTFTLWHALPHAVNYTINNKIVTDTFFTHLNAQPFLQSEKYFISATDSCGNKSAIAPVAQTIYLQGENKDFNAFTLLQYTPYETWNQGVWRYEIEYKNNNSIGWKKLDTAIGNILTAKVLALPDGISTNLSTSQICYRIKAIEQNGNQQMSISNIVCVPVYPIVFIPNAFSPNGDGLNDYFKPVAAGLNAYIFEIYDRWGQLVYSDAPESKGWDGTFRGKALPVGSYVYRLSAAGFERSPSTNDARRVEQKGMVELVR